MSPSDFMKDEQSNEFFRLFQPRFLIVLMGATIVTMIWAGIVVFQVYHRPLPSFYADTPKGERMLLQPQDAPNLTSNTILRFAAKAAVAAYTFDFVNYRTEISAARTYFTSGGWSNYIDSVSQVVKGISANKLFVTGVVNGTPVISNQGELDGIYSWRVQIPFLVTYQSATSSEQAKYTVLVTIVRVPTTTDPLGIGIDQFVMS